MHETELHDLSDDADYAASLQQVSDHTNTYMFVRTAISLDLFIINNSIRLCYVIDLDYDLLIFLIECH